MLYIYNRNFLELDADRNLDLFDFTVLTKPTTSLFANIDGTSGDDNLFGTSDDDVINGLEGNDTITLTGGGNDIVDAGAGNDTVILDETAVDSDSEINGGEGFDLVTVSGNANGFSLSTSTDTPSMTIRLNSTGNYVLSNVERFEEAGETLALLGSSGADVLDARAETAFILHFFLGGAGEDAIYASDVGFNYLWGGTGDDMLVGGVGDDRIDGGAGADTLIGGDGYDTVRYLSSDAGVSIDLSTNTASGGDATGDTISGFENIWGSLNFDDALTGDDSSNWMRAYGGNDTLNGLAGDDDLNGGNGDDIIIGGDGDDILEGEEGNDTIDGGTGSDTAIYSENFANYIVSNLGGGTYEVVGGSEGTDILIDVEILRFADQDISLTNGIDGTSGDDTLVGTADADIINGFAGDDFLYGLDGNDEINGGDGDDVIDGGAGADVIDGGAGRDYLFYFSSDAAVTIDLEAGTASGGHATGDIYTNIQDIGGSDAFADTLLGDAQDNVFLGYGQGDNIDGRGGLDIASYWNSIAGVTIDLATGTASGGHADGDVLTSIEYIEASDFDDMITGDSGANIIWGRGGSDTLIGLDGDDTLLGDTVIVDAGTPVAGDDILNGGLGADTMDGGDGYDFAVYSDATERVWMDLQGNVASRGEAVGDILVNIEGLIGSVWSDQLRGDSGANELYGGGRSDRLYGRAGDDILNGEGGADAIYGNRGADIMTGGDDTVRDRFIFFQLNDSGLGAGNRDIITDFTSGEDRIEISRFDANTSIGGNQIFDFIADAGFSNTAGELRYEKAGGITLIQADVDGDGVADFEIELTGEMDLIATDFLL